MGPEVSGRPASCSTMILSLLFSLLILGHVESQTANATGELSRAGGNRTFSQSRADDSETPQLSSPEHETADGTATPVNVTSSLSKEQSSELEELERNQTSKVITEDDESFQEQEQQLSGRRCHRNLLVEYSHGVCGAIFHYEMLSISSENWCVLEDIIRPYNNMTLCLEQLSNMVGCYYPNPDVQDFFLFIHSHYFQNCSKDSHLLVDAPQGLVIALTLVPVCLIPVLVYLVVWKSEVQE